MQTDIKRVIAYSTMSQIGYMFLAAGLGAYANAMFHLMTHAFFKALLFLAAGIVIHALTGEQDLRKMGGLRTSDAADLLGVPDRVAGARRDAAVLRVLLEGLDPRRGPRERRLVRLPPVGRGHGRHLPDRALRVPDAVHGFWGEPSAFVREHLHHLEGGLVGWTLAVPVGVLAVLAAVGGFVQFAGIWTPISDWLEPSRPRSSTRRACRRRSRASSRSCSASRGSESRGGSTRLAERSAPRPLALLERKFWFDELYDALFYRPAVLLSQGLLNGVERPLVFGSVGELAGSVRDLGLGARRLQTGLVRTYALAIAASLAVVTVVFVVVR